MVSVLLAGGVWPRPAPLSPPAPPEVRPPQPISPALPRARSRPPALLPSAPEHQEEDDVSLDGPTEALVALGWRVQEPLEKQELLLELKARRAGAEVMLALLADPDREVRMVAAESLEVMAEARAVPALKTVLAHERDPEVRSTLAAVSARLQAKPKPGS